MPKMLADGDDLLLWVPDGGIADITTPTVSELGDTGVVDLSCAVTRANFTLGATGDNSISDPALCAIGDSPEPGMTTYSAMMDFFRWTTTPEDEAWTTFTGKGISGFLVHRIGKPYTSALIATDKVAVYGAITGTPQRLTPEIGGKRKFHLDFYVQSEQVDERAVVAA